MPSSSAFVELAARVGAGDDVIGLLRDAAGDLAAAASISALASSRDEVGSVPVSTNVMPRAAPTVACVDARRMLGPVHADGAQLLDPLAIVRLGEEARDALREHGPTSLTSSSCASLASISASRPPKWRARSCAVASPTCRMPSAIDEARERRGLALLDARRATFAALLSAMRSSAASFATPSRYRSAGVRTRFAVDELVDELVAETLDVQRAAAREMQQRLLALRGADQAAGAARDGLAFERARPPSRTPGTASA